MCLREILPLGETAAGEECARYGGFIYAYKVMLMEPKSVTLPYGVRQWITEPLFKPVTFCKENPWMEGARWYDCVEYCTGDKNNPPAETNAMDGTPYPAGWHAFAHRVSAEQWRRVATCRFITMQPFRQIAVIVMVRMDGLLAKGHQGEMQGDHLTFVARRQNIQGVVVWS